MTDKVTVKIVDGTHIRNTMDVDFCMASHGYYSDYIPKGEIWVDKSVPVAERPCLIAHEKFERSLMKRGMKYLEAHAKASVIERKCRAKRKNS